MPAFLGIDMGGTATRWALVDAGGEPMARGTAPGATGHLFNNDERVRFSAVIDEIATEARRHPPSEIHVGAVHAGITGIGPREAPDADAIIAEAVGCSPDKVCSCDDIELAYRAVFKPGGGHLVAAGTGVAAMHIPAEGEPVRVSGRGILVDDAGSGAWIALRALRAVFRRVDATGTPAEAELLAETLFAEIGGTGWDAARPFVYGGDRGRIAGLAPAVAKAAQAGDPVARALLADAAKELSRPAQALIARCGALPVAFIGGVLALDPAIEAGIRAALPGTDLGFPAVDAALAAARLAIELNGPKP